MKLGYVIANDKYEFEDKFIQGSYEDSKNYPDLPKIIIGMSFTDETVEEEIDILNRVLSDGTFWTFTRKEQRKYHNEDIEDFKQHCYDKFVKDFKYDFIDPLLTSDDENKTKFDDIKSYEDIISYHNGDMIYILSNGVVHGINLMFYQYLGIDKDSMITRTKGISTVFLTQDDIIIEYKDYMERLDNQERLIPYLYSMINYAN